MFKLIISASFTSFLFGLFGVTWDKVDEKIATEYPEVPFVSAAQLLDTLSGPGSGASAIDVYLIDVRDPEEYAVSHLSSAQNLSSAAAISSLVTDKSAPIVVYCSVGYRSAGVAQELRQLGYRNVRNLQHSLFGWANAGYPMVNAEGATSQVHPFNRAWGSLVAPELRSYTP
jgi:rhodanese-related sulfurtransferase